MSEKRCISEIREAFVTNRRLIDFFIILPDALLDFTVILQMKKTSRLVLIRLIIIINPYYLIMIFL